MQPFRYQENYNLLSRFVAKYEGTHDEISRQIQADILATLQDISRSLSIIADMMINEDNRRRKEENKEETEKLKQAMEAINKAREGEE